MTLTEFWEGAEDFVQALYALISALAWCWPIAVTSFVLTYLLFKTGQGVEAFLSASPWQWFFAHFGLILLALCMSVYAYSLLGSWRADRNDRYALFGRMTAPIVVGMTGLFLPFVLSGLTGLSTAETEALKSYRVFTFGILMLFILLRPALFWTIPSARPSPREVTAVQTSVVAFVGAPLSQYSPALAAPVAVATMVAIDWFIVARHAPALATDPTYIADQTRRTWATRAAWVIALLSFFGVLMWRTAIGESSWLGAPIILMIAIAFWMSLSFGSMFFSTRPWLWWWVRPATLIVTLTAAILFLTGPYNEADVRRLPSAGAPPARTLLGYVGAWLDARVADIKPGTENASPRSAYPVVIVAAEGGGIRAAYWTAGMLAWLHGTYPELKEHVLAISGVSGGSVGAGVFGALAAAQANGWVACAGTQGDMSPCVRQILGSDLLSSPLAFTLIHDVVRATGRSFKSDERTAALERALEQAFDAATTQATLSQSFAAPWNGSDLKKTPPLILANMTEAGGGGRAVLAPMNSSGVFREANDVAARLPPEAVRMSTAILLSARFPVISATARVQDGKAIVRLVDGGYVDNSGAATAGDMLEALLGAADTRGLRDRLLPVVLLLKNGDSRAVAVTDSSFGQSIAGSLWDPVSTLDGVRAGSAARFEADLKRRVAELNGQVIEFPLAHGTDRYVLGWMLGAATITRMDRQIHDLATGPAGERIGQLLKRM